MSGRYPFSSNRSSLRLHNTQRAKLRQNHRRCLRCEPLEDRRMLSITLFVDADAAPTGDGLAWSTAYNDLQAALDQAAALNGDTTPTNDVDSIWIAEGTYKPSAELEPGDARSASFSLLDGIALYGGFAGTEATLDQRDLSAHVTTLSGDLGLEADNSDNAYTVVYCGANIESTLDGLTVTACYAYGSSKSDHPERTYDGGIYICGMLTITNSTIWGNWAYYGGGIYNSQGTVTVSSSTISNNSAGKGGGISNDTGTLIVTNSTIWDNSSRSYYGGGIYIYQGSVTVTNSTISDNSTNIFGGGIYNYNGTLTLTDSTLSDNSASRGGGICNDSGTLVVTNSTISENSAYKGGGIDNDSGTLTVTNSTISNNTGKGGGIDNGGTLTLTNSTISGSSAGDGIYNFGTATVTNSTISGTSGGILNISGTLTVTNSTISRNSVSGIRNSNDGTVTVASSTISGNSASRGGGIFNSQGTLTVTNSTISGNSARFGGGIDNYSGYIGTLTVTNSTISGNSASRYGGGIRILGGLLKTILNNTIIAKNAAPQGPDVYRDSGKLFGFHILIGDGSGQTSLVDGVNGNIVGTTASPVDPCFVRDPSGSDYGDLHLRSDSPAIDAGSNDLAVDADGNPLTTDLDGNPRIVGAAVDMGTYEWFNRVPEIVSLALTPAIDENESAELALQFTDGDLLDAHTVQIDWGDGAVENVTLAVGERELVIDHPYLDDDPSGTAADDYTVSVTVSDGLDEDTESATVTVSNVAPLVEPIGGPAPGPGVPGQELAFSTEFSDPGTLDTHEVEWDFGDGTVIAFQAATAEALAPTHVYTSVGTFTVSVTIRDDDLGESTQTKEVTIGHVALQDDPLYPGDKMLVVGGTDRNDHIVFAPKGKKGDVKVIFNGRQLGTFRPTSRIVAYGLGGNDLIHLAGSIDIAAWLYGGSGNDRLYGGRGNDLLFGESGNDMLLGQQGRDLLVGGAGRDWILGNSGDDILIAGYLELSNTDDTLRDIMSVWTSDEWDYDTRVDMLSDVLVADDTVKDDTDRDFLFGASGNDWFFYELGRDRVIGRRR